MKLDERQRRLLMRILVLLTGTTAYYFAQDAESSLVLLLATAYGVISQLAPPVISAMYWRRATTIGVLAGLLAGTATSVFFYFNPDLRPFDMHEGVLGLIIHVPVLISVSLMTPIQNDKHLSGFFS